MNYVLEKLKVQENRFACARTERVIESEREREREREGKKTMNCGGSLKLPQVHVHVPVWVTSYLRTQGNQMCALFNSDRLEHARYNANCDSTALCLVRGHPSSFVLEAALPNTQDLPFVYVL